MAGLTLRIGLAALAISLFNAWVAQFVPVSPLGLVVYFAYCALSGFAVGALVAFLEFRKEAR